MKAVESRNYYELLGVEPNATTEEIKSAYRELARIFHPDSNFFDEILGDTKSPENDAAFTRVTDAYQILIHPDKRKEYDESLPKGLRDWEDDAPSYKPKAEWNMAPPPSSKPAEKPIRNAGFGQRPMDQENDYEEQPQPAGRGFFSKIFGK